MTNTLGRAAGVAALVAITAAGCGDPSGNAAAPTTSTQPRTETTNVPPTNWGEIEEEWSGAGPELVVLGDSITVQSRERLHQQLDPDFRTRMAALTGEGFGGGPLSDLEGSESLMHEAAVEFSDATPPNVAVVALGTNDAWNPDLGAETAIANLRVLRELFEDSCLVAVLVNEWSAAEDYDRDDAQRINAELRAVADVEVPALTQEFISADQIHPTARGADEFARRIADGVGRCGTD